ncbi:hypothetical protein C3489_10115 [Streptomyces sp. Ru71]|uniref:hypothetical protein n=1 Tax=Streptomyces sp. Ru71 TaxID=2080746 RepID=UPI000CDD0D0B|nr:hypothetical protein [Streptomyces sp. Ru71]POX55399.1 hypothetical protein C3489_10115 [Streptomyces sp. Ru71]
MAYRTAAALGALFVTALAFGAYGCTSMEGGRVHSADEYRARVDATKEAGARTVLALSPAPDLGGHWPDELAQEESSGSCVDDGDVTRDQPTYSWDLDFADPAAYRAAVDHLRRTWQEEGLTVKNVPAPKQGEPGAGLPGITTTDKAGIDLSLRPDWYSGKPTVRADGGCMRHHGAYDDISGTDS